MWLRSTDGSITITDQDGFTRTIHLSDATTYGDGISLPIEVGEHIHAEGTVDTDGTSLAATVIDVAPEPPPRRRRQPAATAGTARRWPCGAVREPAVLPRHRAGGSSCRCPVPVRAELRRQCPAAADGRERCSPPTPAARADQLG